MRAALLALVLLVLVRPADGEEDEVEPESRSPLSPDCSEEREWTGWCEATGGRWTLESSATTFHHLGCYTVGTASAVARASGLRIAGESAPMQCLRACVESDDYAGATRRGAAGRARFFGVGERDRSCYCLWAASPAAAGLSTAPAAECKPPACRHDAVGPDALESCTTLLGGGLSCGEDFCDNANRCALAGMCTQSCAMPARDPSCNDAHSHSRVQLYAIESAVVPAKALPQTASANACHHRADNVTVCPVVMRRKIGNALTACCACGGGAVNDFGGCEDHENFRDSLGHKCADYATLRLCSDDGFGSIGPGWRAEWGAFTPDANVHVAHEYTEASLEAVIASPVSMLHASEAILTLMVDDEPLSRLGAQVAAAQRGLTTWSGSARSELNYLHQDDPGRLGLTMAPLAGTHVEIQGHNVMAPCGFHSVRALTETKACRSCDAWWDAPRDELSGAALAQSGRGRQWYYEIVVGDDGIAQVGFAAEGFVPTASQGVGDDANGWAFDGNRVVRWHDTTPDVDDGTLEDWQVLEDGDGDSDYGEQWYQGDVVGCLLDLREANGGTISFTLTTPGEDTRQLGKAFDLTPEDRVTEFFPAATIVEGVWTFRFGPEELQYAPPNVEFFTPPTRPANLIHASGSLPALSATVSSDGCLDMLVRAADPAASLLYSFVFTRTPLDPEAVGAATAQICSLPLEPECDTPALTADTMVMWVILGSAATIGLLTMFTMIQGERLRRRRQFQLISGAALQLDNESVQQVLINDAARTHFRQKYEGLQRMLFGFGRNGLIDITVARATLLRDVIELFDARPELSQARTLRSQGLRIRFVDELGIDEGGLRREFYQVLFAALVDPQALKLGLPAPENPPSETAEVGVLGSRNGTDSAHGMLALFEELPDYTYGVNHKTASATHQLGTDAMLEMIKRIVGAAGNAGDVSPARMAAGFASAPTRAMGMGSWGDGIELEVVGGGSSMRAGGAANPAETQAYLLSNPAARRDSDSFEPEPEPEPEMPGMQLMTPPPRPPTARLRRPRMAQLRTLTSLPAVREALRRGNSGDPGSGSRDDELINSLMQGDSLAMYRLCGIFLAKAIIDDVRLNVIFSRSLYCQLLSQPVGLDELKKLDEELHSSLTWLLETDLNDEEKVEGGPETLGLYFDAILPTTASPAPVGAVAAAGGGGGTAGGADGGMVVAAPQAVELKPGGSEILVTQENKQEFVDLRVAWAHSGLIEPQLQALRDGFFRLLPDFGRLDFNGAELELLLHGVPDVNLADWKHHTVYRSGFDEEHPTIVAFWDIVEAMDQDMRGKLVHFTTGCSRVPLEGFSALRGDGRICRFTIACTDQPLDALPRAHCCFNRLEFPAYPGHPELQQKLEQAITEGHDGFHTA